MSSMTSSRGFDLKDGNALSTTAVPSIDNLQLRKTKGPETSSRLTLFSVIPSSSIEEIVLGARKIALHLLPNTEHSYELYIFAI